MEGRTFGDFVLKQRLGAGGGGEVYLAEQTTLGREAVIKVMLRGERGADADQRFLREARLASQLDHPFAAHVYGFGAEADGVLWIAMELVRGASLDAVVKSEGAMPLPRFVPFFERLCEVLHAAHEQGIVHRDIKPANVMVLTRSGRLLPKLLDLGIARRDSDPLENALTVDEAAVTGEGSPAETLSGTLASQLFDCENTHLTPVGALVGTPHYMRCVDWVDSGSVMTAGGTVAFSHFGHSGLVSACSMLGERTLTGDQSGGIGEWDSTQKRGEPIKTYPEKTIVWGVDGVTGPYATVSDTALSLVLADGSAMAVDPALKPSEINDLMAAPDQQWGVASVEDRLFVLRRRGGLFAVESASPSTHTDSIAFAPDSSKLAVTASGLITVLNRVA